MSDEPKEEIVYNDFFVIYIAGQRDVFAQLCKELNKYKLAKNVPHELVETIHIHGTNLQRLAKLYGYVPSEND